MNTTLANTIESLLNAQWPSSTKTITKEEIVDMVKEVMKKGYQTFKHEILTDMQEMKDNIITILIIS